ncbi:Pseudouridine synthase family protein [Prunus dulcis]|uniref:tRNA pseudouridine synthase n=1 Tax=Prunus dulcis TaxID=3755 RepID=A0A4Y1QWF5_PRUDU|nr:Pseudouridine synthase family protein [Prunus dulcis]
MDISKTTDDLSDDEQQQQQQQQPESMSQRPGIQRYLLAIEYIGTRFSGLSNSPIAEAFHKFIGQPVSMFCSSRTDAGVHALSNVCHVDVERISKRKPGEVLEPHEPAVVKRAVNHFLQKNEGDVMVIDVRSVPANFHARYKAQERTYFYRLLSGAETLSTFEKDRAWHVPEELNLRAMQAKSPIRTLDELNVSEVVSTPCFPSIMERKQNNLGEDPHAGTNKSETDPPPSFNGGADLGFGLRKKTPLLCGNSTSTRFSIPPGRGPLTLSPNRVRLLVGVLKAVGTGDLKVPDVERILNAKTVTAASPMAPACGLYLGHVKYDLP